ncbi:non-hydrolyzing UDP-N-acetylglucosamine 2-epimerase [Brevibacillus sp. SYSU BS000544]|uniref:non-hydrolyzing UDP-N-acetylglucosamine 2-epimerase n=1 Tax=Brevibacillus sp. SYSU BS000544 TaxID=3416443 RepID=UPI003CE4B1BB
MKKKILTVIGTRPQLVKVAAVSRKLRNEFNEVLVDTGQHYDYNMAGVFFDELEIPKPDYTLGIGSGSHGYQTGSMIIRLEEIVLKEAPDAILVYGDTNSTLSGAIVASKLQIPLIHIEAGLRSYNKKMPEEINRVMTDHVSTILYAPTKIAQDNLKREGIEANVFVVGDVMYDAVQYYWERAEQKYQLGQYGIESKQYHLVTVHRAENTDDPTRLAALVKAFKELGEVLIWPLHPRTKKSLAVNGLLDDVMNCPHIKLIDPVSYLEMLLLEKNARTIITDSGGVQKEAYFAKVPCFTLRNETEWVETVECGWNQLVDPVNQNLQLLIKQERQIESNDGIYGDGNAALHIVEHLKTWFME